MPEERHTTSERVDDLPLIVYWLLKLHVVEAIRHSRAQWQPERGFPRFKRGRLSALPLYLQDDTRIRGLMLLLGIALRVLTLMEFVVRRTFQAQPKELAGLYDGNPHRAINRPTPENLLAAFQGISLYRHPWGGTSRRRLRLCPPCRGGS